MFLLLNIKFRHRHCNDKPSYFEISYIYSLQYVQYNVLSVKYLNTGHATHKHPSCEDVHSHLLELQTESVEKVTKHSESRYIVMHVFP